MVGLMYGLMCFVETSMVHWTMKISTSHNFYIFGVRRLLFCLSTIAGLMCLLQLLWSIGPWKFQLAITFICIQIFLPIDHIAFFCTLLHKLLYCIKFHTFCLNFITIDWTMKITTVHNSLTVSYR